MTDRKLTPAQHALLRKWIALQDKGLLNIPNTDIQRVIVRNIEEKGCVKWRQGIGYEVTDTGRLLVRGYEDDGINEQMELQPRESAKGDTE